MLNVYHMGMNTYVVNFHVPKCQYPHHMPIPTTEISMRLGMLSLDNKSFVALSRVGRLTHYPLHRSLLKLNSTKLDSSVLLSWGIGHFASMRDNVGIAYIMLLLSCLQDIRNSRLEAANLDFWLPVTSDSIANSTVGFLAPEKWE